MVVFTDFCFPPKLVEGIKDGPRQELRESIAFALTVPNHYQVFLEFIVVHLGIERPKVTAYESASTAEIQASNPLSKETYILLVRTR